MNKKIIKYSVALLPVLIMVLLAILGTNSQEKKLNQDKSLFNTLTPEEERVIIYKGTEAPFTGKFYNYQEKGVYVCKRCNSPLYKSDDKFDSGCGWPSFDDEIPGAVRRQLDADGHRTEILCNNCGAHLGHVFYGEGFTDKNTRHCVNSISLNFIKEEKQMNKKAYFAGGCFWGVEYQFKKVKGVVSLNVGYMGGHIEKPTYEQVCTGRTGHLETMEVVYNPAEVDYETLAKLFFEIHDPTQANGQGPDIGEQYQSAVFYTDEEQKQTTEKLIQILKEKGYKVVTQVRQAKEFWIAEDYHQDYYSKTGKKPYCHFYTKRF
ncbi:bifunctional methionine sulfoxide reductase B/A protein [Bacteroidetes/Chlorobi group bacterium ChocPot_Mid]|nr:MAG: bifunctional methionine sulfoxide reductase B/A protein [Bacteroidetes/Chlorobi group bacterium ChocPot_Mid]